MANLVQWKRPSMLSLQRDIEDVIDDVTVPRSIRREMDRLFDQVSSPRSLWREMERLMDEFDSPPRLGTRLARVFENFFGETSGTGSRSGMGMQTFAPSLDLVEQDNEYVLKADLPGIREQDIDVHVSGNNILTISGERRDEEHKKMRGYEYNERTYGSFSRSVELPAGIDPNKIQADFRNGVLELHVPKSEAALGRRIPLSRGDEPRVMEAGNGHGVQGQQSSQSQSQNQKSQQRT